MKRKLVSVLLTTAMVTSSLGVVSAESMGPAAETSCNEVVQTEAEVPETQPEQTESEPESEAVTEIQTESQTESQTVVQQTESQTSAQTDKEAEPQTGNQTDMQTEAPKSDQTDEPAEVQTDVQTDAQTETEAVEETEETEETGHMVTVKTEKADVFFVSDLQKLKEGVLEDPDLKKDPVPETESDTQEKKDKRAAAIKAAGEILPDEYVKILNDESYQLLMKQEHTFSPSAYVDFYVVPEEGYEVDTVKAASSVYGELQVTDYENGAYEAVMPDDAVLLDVKAKEKQAESEMEPETETEKTRETENGVQEHFLEKAEGTESLDASHFSSMRLVVLASDRDMILDPEHLIGEYDNIYLLQYTSVEQAMNAYVYYLGNAEAVEPDTAVVAASDEPTEEKTETEEKPETEAELDTEAETEADVKLETEAETEAETKAEPETKAETEADVKPETMPETEAETKVEPETTGTAIPSQVTADAIDNPISTLAGEQDSAAAQAESKVIALLDTGAEGSNVIDQVSMIDGGLVGSGSHASVMVDAITEQNPDAKILSVRVLGDDNLGTVSSIVAGMEYAIAQKVDFINLSLYARKSLSNSVLASEIQKAVDAGIQVAGAAGNDGADVINYMPGSVESAWIIGACDEEGNRIESSNYGATVDYNVTGDSTSVAAARFTGYISKYGTEDISSDIIFTSDGVTTDKEEVSDKEEDFEGAAVLAGTQAWGTAIDFTYGSGFLSLCKWQDATFSGFGAQQVNTGAGEWGASSQTCVYRRCTQTGSFDKDVYVKVPNIGGYYTGNGYVSVDAKIFCYSDQATGFVVSAADTGHRIRFGSPYLKTNKKVAINSTNIHLRYRFYISGTNSEISMTGTGAFSDIDADNQTNSLQMEGYKFVRGVGTVYTSADTEIIKRSKAPLSGFYVGTKNSDAANHEKSLMFTFASTPAAPFEIIYHCGGYYTSSMTYGSVALNYHLINNPPTNTKPTNKRFAMNTNTASNYGQLSGYQPVPGYNFSGWHRDSANGPIYVGDYTMAADVNLYGWYTKQYGSLTVWKGLDGGPAGFYNTMPLANRTFQVRLYGTSTTGEWYDQTLSLTVGNTNYVTFSNVPVGTYTLVESGIDSRYWYCSTGPLTITITNGGSAGAEIHNWASFGNLTVKKVLANVTEEAISNAAEKKFQFTLFGTSAYNTPVNETRELTGSGSVTFSSIPAGTYTLKESYYDGKIWTPFANQQVTIEKNVTKEVSVVNTFIPERTQQPKPIKSLNTYYREKKRLEKKKIKDRTEEVTFSIFQQVNASSHEAVAPTRLTVTDVLEPAFEYKGFKAYVGDGADDSWTDDTASFKDATNGNTVSLYKDASFMSGQWYRFDITVKVREGLNLDKYVQDVDGVNMYVIPNTASSTFTYKSGTPKEVTQNTNTVIVRVPIDELSIIVKKSNEVTGENIANVEFTVYEWDGTEYSIIKGKMAYDEYQNNYIIKNLKKTETNQGKFKIVETVTPWGHTGSWSKEVVVGNNATETYEAANPMGTGTITVIKNGTHGEVLAGAIYSIRAKKDIVSPQGKVLVTSGTEVDTVTTGDDGTAKSKELYPGMYTVTETKAPLGYALNETPQDAEVKYKDKDTKVTNTSVTFVNERLYSMITLTKEIDTADIVWEHGNPTFTFQVDGTDVLGNPHTYYQTVEFTTANAGNGSKSTLSTTFEVLAGTYTVSEEKTARYRLDSIHDVVSGTVNGQTAVLDVSGKKDGTLTEGPKGAATFYNVKTTDEDLTHTAFVENTIA